MLTNFVRAKLSTHTLTIALGVLVFSAHHFFADPHAAAWLNAHWVLSDLGSSIGAALGVYAIYASPTKRDI